MNIPANVSKIAYIENIDQLLHGEAKEDIVIFTQFTDKKGATYQNNYFLLKQKEIRFPQVNIQHNITPKEGGFEIELESYQFARAVFISIGEQDNFFHDNYFDLLPGKKKIIAVDSKLSLSDIRKQIKINSLVDGFSPH